jgi:CRP-like cAMP-binding protein
MPHSNNCILNLLPEDERNLLAPLLKSQPLKQHCVLFDAAQLVEKVHFPINAAVSLVVPLSTGETIETAMVGRDGVTGAAAAINGRVAANKAVVQMGGDSLSCEVNALRHILDQCPALSALLVKHQELLLAHVQQTAACNAVHTVESRLARRLLRARDLAGKDELDLTQEYLAEMLGVRRSSVTLIAHTLKQAGLLTYSRGHIKIVNVEALKEVACECYETVKLHYEALAHASNE